MEENFTDLSKENSGLNLFPIISEAEYPKFFEMFPNPVFVVDFDDNFIFVNSAAEKFLDCKPNDLNGKKITGIIRPEEFSRWENFKKQFSSNEKNSEDWEFLQKNGKWIWGEISARRTNHKHQIIFVNNISARKTAEKNFLESEERRWQMQKIEALGKLAGGVAHDFNNLLAVVLLHVDMLNLQLSPESPLRHRVIEIKSATNKAAEIVRQLMAFGRKQPMKPQPIILNDVISGFHNILSSFVGEEIRIELELEPNLGVCFADQKQIIQILTNLAVNAKDAMPQGGILKIKTSNIILDKNDTHKAQSGGSYIQLSIADNGVGMDTETINHVFEPFFSTKESDKGAGLGLAMVYGIVKQSGGYIWAESKINEGTIFKIQFSRIDQQTEFLPKAEIEEPATQGNQTILLVEDEEMVRRIAAEVLQMSGYEVLEASSGMEALAIAQTSNRQIHLLLTDFYMPQMNGKEVADKLENLYPEISVLFMSGDVEDVISNDETSQKEINFIGKPFSPTDLILKIEKILKS